MRTHLGRMLVRRLVVACACGPLVLLGACGSGGTATSVPDTPAAATSAPAGAPASAPASDSAGTPRTASTGGAAGALPSACDLVPPTELAAVTGKQFGAPAPTSGSGRSVCTFPAAVGGPGLTVGVEAATRFARKADASRSSVGVPGEPVAGVGEEALFFYSDRDLPEGLGGLLVRNGPAAVDITLQGGGPEAATRQTAVAIGKLVAGRL